MRHLGAIAAIFLAAPAARGDTVTQPFAAVMVEQLYDSNVMNERGQDMVTRVTPRIGVLLETRRLVLGGDYRLALHTYALGTADSTINHRGAIRARVRATPRLDVYGDAVLLRGDDPVLLDRPGVAIPQGAFLDLVARAGVEHRATRRLDLGASYLYRRSRFDLAQAADPLAFDGDEHRLDATGAYRLSRRWTTRAVARAQHFVAFGSSASLGQALGAGAGVELRLGERTRARAQGGPLWFTGGGVGWFGGCDLTRVGERWRVALRALHDVYGGTSAAEAVWSDSISADGLLRLARHVDLRVRAGAYRGGIAPNYDPDVSGLIARAELGWVFFRKARLELYAEHRAQDADGGTAFGDVQRTVAGLRLSAVIGTDITSIGELP
jgi:hypothetical protein